MAPKNTMNVKINTMDAVLEFSILPTTTGKQLFDQVVKTIGIRELWYFGLYFKDNTGMDAWVKLNKRMKDQDLPKDAQSPEFQFRVKYFPEEATEELIQDMTLKLFYLQVKETILNDAVFCPPEAAVLLASYAMQAKYGDQEEKHIESIKKDLEQNRVLPKRVCDQHPTFTSDNWAKKISEWHREHKGLLREDTMREYLKIAQDLDMYGVTYFNIKNKKGTELHLGVDAIGISVYEKDNKLTPRIGFPWSEISNISFSGTKFTIKPIDKRSPEFVIRVEKARTNKNILAICMGNHELYMRRRKPDSIEVQQMRAEALAMRQKRMQEKEAVERERKAREELEQQKRELQERLDEAERRASESAKKLEEKESENALLRSKLNDVQGEIERMEAERHDLLAEKELLAKRVSEGDMTKEEYNRRMLEIQEEYKQVQEQLNEKETEAENLRDNLVQTKAEKDAEMMRLHEEMEAKLAANDRERDSVRERVVYVHDHTSVENTNGVSAVSQDDDSSDQQDQQDHDFVLSSEGVDNLNSELDRKTAISEDQSLSNKLLELQSDLNAARDQTVTTKRDEIHQSNVKEGRDKYKTLNLIRRGNTKSRVNEFEAM